MIEMVDFVEQNGGYMNFNVFVHAQSEVPVSICIETVTVADLVYRLVPANQRQGLPRRAAVAARSHGVYDHILWPLLFDLNAKIFKSATRWFGRTLHTDGAAYYC